MALTKICIKRHIAVDTNSLLHTACVNKADDIDRSGAYRDAYKNHENLSQVQNIFVDAGYAGEKFANSVSKILGCTVEVVRRSDMHSSKVIPKRSIVESSFS